LHKWVRVW